MAAERDLSLRLNLVANFAGAAKEAAENLRSIATGIDDLKNLSIPLGTITGQMNDLNRATGLAKNSMGGLATNIERIKGASDAGREGVDRVVSSIIGLDVAGAKADVAVSSLGKKVKEAGGAAAAAVTPTQDLGHAVTVLGAETAATIEEINSLVGAVRTLEREIATMRPASIIRLTPADMAAMDEIRAITRSIQELNASLAVPRHLSLVVQQPAPLVVRPGFVTVGPAYVPGLRALPAGAPGEAFTTAGSGPPPGLMPPSYWSRVLPGGARLALPGGSPGAAWGAGAEPGATPWSPLERDMTTAGYFGPPPQTALPPGRESSFYWGQGPGAPGGFNWRVWNARQRERMGNDLGGGGAAIPGMGGINAGWVRENIPNVGQDLTNFGREGLRAGNTMQSAGTGAVVNAVMIAGLLTPVVKSMTDIKDLFARTYEALKSSGATDENAKKFAQGVADMSKQFGGDYRQNVAAIYNFASAIPPTANIDFNDAAQSKKLQDAFGKIIKLQIAGSSSTHPMSMEETTLNVLATAENLGLHMRNATELGQAVEYVTNATIQMKNKTATEADLFANSIKAIGPIAANMGIPPEQIIGLVAAEAAGKIRGAPAGQNIKRLFSRQALPPKQLQDLMDEVHKAGGDISMFNDKGESRNLFEWIDSIGKFEKQKNLPAEVRAKLQGLLSGLYAAPGFGELVRFLQDIGGSGGMKKYTDDLLHKPLAGSAPGESPLQSAFKARTTGNLLTRSQRTESHFLDEAGKTFDRLEPKMEKFLDGVDGLIDAWGKLSPAVQENVVTWTAWLGIGSAVSGIAMMIVGNFIKLGSAITLGIGAALKLFDHLMGFKALEGVWGRVLAPLLGLGADITAAVAAIDLVPIAIAAIPIALVGLVAAWHNNWGHIREHTKAALDGIKNLLGNLAEGLGYELGKLASAWSSWWSSHKNTLGQDVLNALSWPNIFDVGVDLGKTLLSGIWDGLKGIANLGGYLWDKLRQGGTEGSLAGPSSMAGAASALQSGQGFADYGKSGAAGGEMFARSMGANLGTTGKQAVREGLSGIGDLFPHSEPKDSSSPLHGLENSGRSAADMWIIGAIMGIGSGHAKIKKALKGPVDAFITLKTESVDQIKELASKIEAEFAAVGVKTRQGMIDLFDPKTQHITRVSGSAQAFRAAAAEFHGTKDTSVQQASDYLAKIRREIEHGLPVNMDQALLHMEHLSTSALSAHATAEINDMIDKVRKAWEKFPNTIASEFAKNKQKFASELMNVSASGDRFDTLQGQQDRHVQDALNAIKDSSMPTSKELKNVISSEAMAHDKLQMAILGEIEGEKKLAAIKEDLRAKIDSLNGSDRLQQQERENLKAQLAELDVEYSAVDDRITQQKEHIDDLTASMEKQISAIKDARDTWEGLFRDVLKKTLPELQTRPLKGIADHIQGYFALQNDPKGAAGSNYHRQQANNYANNVIQNLFQDVFDTSANSTLGILHTKGAHKKDPEQTNYYTKSGNSLDKIDKNTQFVHVDGSTQNFQDASKDLLGQINVSTKLIATNLKNASGNANGSNFDLTGAGKGSSSNPLPVWISSQTGGSTDLGQQISDSLSGQSSTGIFSAFPKSFADMTKDSESKGNTKTSLEKFQDLAGKIGDYYSLYEGLRAGGVGGGIQAGMSAAALTGNPYLIGAAALAGFIGIGPHETPQQQPDLSDPYYQQLLPNLSGTQQMLGTQMIQPQTQYSTYAGNQNLAQQLYTFLANPASVTGLNPSQIQSINQLKALAGNNPNGLGIKSEHQGVATLNSGQQINVTDFENMIQNVTNIMTQFQNSMLTQQQNADRLASSFTSMTLMGPSGFIMPDLAGGSSVGAGSAVRRVPSAGGGAAPGFRTSQSTMSVQISILSGATVQSGADVQAAIDRSLPAITNAVHQANYSANRLMGDYVSETL